MLGDSCPTTEPDPFVTLDVLEQPRQRSDPAGATDDPPVKADAHHARSPFDSHAIKPVESITAIRVEILARAEVAPTLQTAIVGIEGVRDDEMSMTRDFGPERKIVVIGIAVIEKSAHFHEQP